MSSDAKTRSITNPITIGDWQQYANNDTFNQYVGPFFFLLLDSAEEPVRIGLQVEERHCNPMGHCHGGMLSTMMDISLGYAGLLTADEKVGVPTISLSIDFLQVAPLGDWIESRTRLIHATRRMLFMEGSLVTASGPIARGNAIFRRNSSPR